jgi:hypothetical protein
LENRLGIRQIVVGGFGGRRFPEMGAMGTGRWRRGAIGRCGRRREGGACRRRLRITRGCQLDFRFRDVFVCSTPDS